MVTVGNLRWIANRILDQLYGLDDEEEIGVSSNTYGMSHPILETKDGFIDCCDVFAYDDDEEEDEL